MPTNTSRHTTPARSSAPVAAALMRQDSPCVATGGARAARGSHPGAACQEKASTNASLPCLRRSSGRSASTASSAPRAKASIGPRVPGTRISTSSARSCSCMRRSSAGSAPPTSRWLMPTANWRRTTSNAAAARSWTDTSSRAISSSAAPSRTAAHAAASVPAGAGTNRTALNCATRCHRARTAASRSRCGGAWTDAPGPVAGSCSRGTDRIRPLPAPLPPIRAGPARRSAGCGVLGFQPRICTDAHGSGPVLC